MKADEQAQSESTTHYLRDGKLIPEEVPYGEWHYDYTRIFKSGWGAGGFMIAKSIRGNNPPYLVALFSDSCVDWTIGCDTFDDAVAAFGKIAPLFMVIRQGCLVENTESLARALASAK